MDNSKPRTIPGKLLKTQNSPTNLNIPAQFEGYGWEKNFELCEWHFSNVPIQNKARNMTQRSEQRQVLTRICFIDGGISLVFPCFWGVFAKALINVPIVNEKGKGHKENVGILFSGFSLSPGISDGSLGGVSSLPGTRHADQKGKVLFVSPHLGLWRSFHDQTTWKRRPLLYKNMHAFGSNGQVF